MDFLSTVAGQSALALENARLFTNLRCTFDQMLEMNNLRMISLHPSRPVYLQQMWSIKSQYSIGPPRQFRHPG